MLHRSLTLFSALTFLTAGTLVPPAQAQDFNTLNLQLPVTFDEFYEARNAPNGAIKLGLMRIVQKNADATGGSVIVSVGNSPGCPAGSSQQFAFRWTFQRGNLRDASQIVNGGAPLIIAFAIQRLGSNGTCINEDPAMSLYGGADPFGQRPGGTFYYDPSRHLQYGPPGSGNAFSHTPGPWQVFFRYQDPARLCTPAAIAAARQANSTGSTGACSLGIVITNFASPPMGFELHVNYVYAPGGATTPPPPTSGAQVLTNWAGQHPAFGRPVSPFTPYAPGFLGGRRITCISPIPVDAQRWCGWHYVIFWDPDAERWSGWVRV